MNDSDPSTLHFDVSTGLKSVLGSELITDDEVAIFELVKNSFDADSTRVDLFFGDIGNEQIVIADNGIGMSFEDIQQKWLRVGYSSKRDDCKNKDFRNDISDRRHYAGSKGIGRFSADRLGEVIKLQTKSKTEKSGYVHCITVDWNLFDINHQERFEEIGIKYFTESKGYNLPFGLPALSHGTVITIEKTRQIWDREKILRLKSALAKLINPFGAAVDGFRIIIHSPSELETDRNEKNKGEEKRH